MKRCFFCFGQLRCGVTSCKLCKSLLWKQEHEVCYGSIPPKCLFTFSQRGSPMLGQSIKFTAPSLRQARQVLSAAGNTDKVSKMKRSMDHAAASDCPSSDLSSNLAHASLHGGDGEEKAAKPARRREKSRSSSRKSQKGSPVKIGKLKHKGKDSPQSAQDEVKTEAQEAKSAAKEVAELVTTSSGLFQVKRMVDQFSSAELQSYSMLRDRAAQYAASRMVVQSNNSRDVQSSLAAVAFPFFQDVHSSTWTPTFNPSYCPPLLTTNCISAHSYHSSSQSSVPSQPQKEVRQSYEESVKQVEIHHGSGWHSVSVIRTSMSESNTSEVSRVLSHWDQDGCAGSDMTTVDSAADEETGEAIPLDDYKSENYDKKLENLPRQWELTSFGASQQNRWKKKWDSHHKDPVEFTVMTYNILSQDLLEQHPYLYNGKSSRSLKWKHRRRGLIAEIACHNPDILNLQEVHRDHFLGYLKPRLNKLGYVGGYVKRTGDKSDGCATMWKKSKFRLLHSTPVSYCRGGLLDRDNIAVVVELQPVRPAHHRQSAEEALEDKIVVANTHLLFNPRRGDIKLAQLMILMAEIDKHAYLGPAHNISPTHSGCASFSDSFCKGRYCPVIMTGDLNLEPHSELYKFIISGQMQYEGQLANQLSGQEEGFYGRSVPLNRHFFSPRYGVTDSCQHQAAVIHRLNESKNLPATVQAGSSNDSFVVSSHSSSDCNNLGQAAASEKSASGETVSQSGSDVLDSGTEAADAKPSACLPSSTGQVRHHLNLVSAYRHTIQRLGHRESEVTTHHNRARCTVDYILYTVDSKDVSYECDELRLSNVRHGRLKLVARYGLLSDGELEKMGGIPNTVLPSDHLFLMTKFLLK